MEDHIKRDIGGYIPQEIPIPGSPSPYGKPRKNSGAKIMIAAACFLLAVAAAGISVVAYIRSTPGYKLGRGLRNLAREVEQAKNPLLDKIGFDGLMSMMHEDGSHTESSLNFSAELPFFGTTTIGIDTELYKDIDARELSAVTKLSLMNYEFAQLLIAADKDVFCFSVPELFIENMYIDNENVVSQYNRSIFAKSGFSSDLEEFSIDLFGDKEKKTVLDIMGGLGTVRDQFAQELGACREKMELEKAGKGLYRVSFPAKETDRLFQSYVRNYQDVYGMEKEMEMLLECGELISSDIALLFEIDRQNRIESIILEEPVEMLDGRCLAGGEIFFLGEDRSIDKIQGKISLEVSGASEKKVFWQVQLAPEENLYRFDMDLKLAEDVETVAKVKYTVNCDAAEDVFDMTFAWEDGKEDFGFEAAGSIDEVVSGESLKIDLEEALLCIDGEEMCKLTGDILIEPLCDEVRTDVKAKTAFFEMTGADWADILDKIDKKYRSLLNSLW